MQSLFCHPVIVIILGAFDLNMQGLSKTTRYASYPRSKTNHASRFFFWIATDNDHFL
ncbi:hypothetical protein ECL_01586 [Enterobacter cloacae subsp. cloacae ATCC 13047]|uniref:Uncharacterized protein n=1 Tax=Enterobacter cloacae subsp. cloacae (strain ATCC 13047 / DSM 30054 / NBRC 13535 / NCTC 10005 / WDCM 00083 / NCDC 279-56) TaxID=716541 RepID=A0A0H3CHM4_ENTCC|nr:hypothetical protein ECL_01586 [Enterobacter cloacae subsp. cloacae ATCC 13047]